VTLALGVDRAFLTRRGLRLEYLTIGWNLAEAAIGLSAAAIASSAALLGFGVDSIIESASGLILLWRLRGTAHQGETRERLAHRLVGVTFMLLAAYVLFDAASGLLGRAAPAPSRIGIGLAFASLLVMPLLARAKRRVGHALGSSALVADSRQTDLCAWLSLLLLVGLSLNALLGLWWADAASALVMVPIIVREGIDALRGKVCATCSSAVS
jgi:divalent metal cation (Fe/Co/Zn/Cd) transporter